MKSATEHTGFLTAILSNLNFRGKFFLMVAMPLLGLFIFASISLYERISLYSNMQLVSRQAEKAVAVSALVHELQKERGLTAGYIGSQGSSFSDDLAAQRKVTDKKAAELLAVFQSSYSAGLVSTAQAKRISVKDTAESHLKPKDRTNRNQTEMASLIISEFGSTADLRTQTDSLSVPAGTAIQYYTNRISSLVRFIDAAATSSTRNEITLLLITYVNLIKSKENAGQERAVLNNTFARNSFGPGLYERFLNLVSAQNSFNDAFLATAPVNIIKLFNEKMSHPSALEAERMRKIAAEKGAEGNFGVNPPDWFRIQTEKINLVYEVETAIADSLKSESSRLLSSAFLQLIFFGLLTLLSSIMSLVILYATSGNIQKRTGTLLEKMGAITNGDLTIRLSAHGKDEIAQVEIRFNELVEALHALIGQINRTVTTLSTSSAELMQTSTSMASEMEESSIQATNISAMVEEMNQTLVQVSSSVEEMSITIGEVARRASDAAAGSREGNSAAENMESLILELGNSTRKIGTVMENIGTIADQTNLLALNAAIEAAGAGDAGRGFAVVASEVKELAVQSGQFSRDAKDQIGGVLKNVDKSVSAVGNIVKTIKNGLEAVVTIAAAVEEQSVAVKEIANSVAQISLASKETASNVAGIAVAAKNGARSADNTATLAKNLENVASEIRSQVSRFRVDG